jgi:hypothetical protein
MWLPKQAIGMMHARVKNSAEWLSFSIHKRLLQRSDAKRK